MRETLTAHTADIADEDGLTNVAYQYQWVAGGSDINGATSSTYTLTASEQGKTIKVKVSFTDDADNEETLTSEATVEVAAAPNRDATGAPTISGTPQVRETLTADTADIADEDGLTNVAYRYQWIAGGSDINGATSSTYTLTASEQGKTIKVKVSFTDDADNEETLTSEATVEVAAAPNRDATGAPTISGTPQVRETLTADTADIADEDGLTNVAYRYQWIAGGSDINGATSSTYTLTAERRRARPSRSRCPSPTTPTTPEFADQRGHRYGCGNEAGRPRAPKRLPSRRRSAGRLLGSPGQRRRLRHYRLQGAVERERRQLGHAGGRIGGNGVRNHPHHHGTDRRGGVQRAGPGHQRRGRQPALG